METEFEFDHTKMPVCMGHSQSIDTSPRPLINPECYWSSSGAPLHVIPYENSWYLDISICPINCITTCLFEHHYYHKCTLV